MAGRAIEGEPGGCVSRIRRGIVVLQVAPRISAGCRQAGIDLVDVASCTRDADMGTGQGENRLAMIEQRRHPGGSRVTRRAIRRESRVRRVRRGLKIRLMAADARGRRSGEHPADVALRARHRKMSARQRER